MLSVGIIGASGFIGQSLTKRLHLNPSLKISAFSRTNIKGSSVSWQILDVRNFDQHFTLFNGLDVIYYLASDSIPFSSWDNPKADITSNLLPFLNFLEKAVEAGVKKVVFISSGGTVYGPSEDKISENAPKVPYSPYGINKLSMEYYLMYYHQRFGIAYDIFRVSNVYGPGQDITKGLGVINTFLHDILKKGKITIYGDGKIIRNYIYIDDVAELLSISVNNIGESRIFNLSSDADLNLNEIISNIKNTVSEKFHEVYVPGRKSDNPCIRLENSKILSVVPGFKFKGIREGIEQTYKSMKID